MPSKLKKAIGAVKDQTSISLAKVSANTNSANLEVTVLKATSHDVVPIEDKYVQEILTLISSNKSYASSCAQAIARRIGKTRDWIVALKSLMLVLRIFQDGDPYFPIEVLHAMKRGAKILNLYNFRDDSNSCPGTSPPSSAPSRSTSMSASIASSLGSSSGASRTSATKNTTAVGGAAGQTTPWRWFAI
ncbi:hypothetical protein GBA52_011215 [Prunus armeniaca]|nr:hypothetical protein GBA52_011215 [Prunus armeniaca]